MPTGVSINSHNAATDLQRALVAIGRTQTNWLEDLLDIVSGDPSFMSAFRRWEEQLTLLKLQLHRAESRLQHFVLMPEDHRPTWRDLPGPHPERQQHYRRWYNRIQPYFRQLHIDTTYRRLADIRDPQTEAINADIITDFVSVAECAESTNEALSQCHELQPTDGLEDIAYFHVISPWKQQGLQALMDVCLWLRTYLVDNEDL